MSLAYRILDTVNGIDVLGAMCAAPCFLMYHRVGEATRRRAMPSSTFEAQLAYLRARHHVFTASVLCRLLDQGRAPADAVAITIDDGYFELHEEMLPLLQKYSLPATVYLVTDFVDGQMWLWPDQVAHIMLTSPLRRWEFQKGNVIFSYDFLQHAARIRAWNDVADACLDLPPADRDAYIRSLAGELDAELPDTAPPMYRAVTWDQVRDLKRAGLEIGSHGCSHPRLTLLEDTDLRHELVRSRERLEAEVDAEVHSFCYPHGTPADVDLRVREHVRRAGYTSAFTSYPESIREHDPLLRPRFAAPSHQSHFKAVVRGIEAVRHRA